MYKALQYSQLLLLNDLILDRREANLTTKASVCLQISDSRVKNDLFLGERNMIRTAAESRRDVTENLMWKISLEMNTYLSD